MKSKAFIWCSAFIVIALWFGYAMGYRQGARAERTEFASWVSGPNGLRGKTMLVQHPTRAKNAVRSDFSASGHDNFAPNSQ
jgi:hypothetical protein